MFIFLSKQTRTTKYEMQWQAQRKNEQDIENLPKSRLNAPLTEKRSSNGKLVVRDDEGKNEQLVKSAVTMKKQCERTLSRRKLKSDPKMWNLTIYRDKKKPRHSKGHAAWQCFLKPNEKTCRLTASLNWCDPSLKPQMTCVPWSPKTWKKKQIICPTLTRQLPCRTEIDRLGGIVGSLPPRGLPKLKILWLSKANR